MLTPARAKECVSERPNKPFRIPWSDLVAMRPPATPTSNSTHAPLTFAMRLFMNAKKLTGDAEMPMV